MSALPPLPEHPVMDLGFGRPLDRAGRSVRTGMMASILSAELRVGWRYRVVISLDFAGLQPGEAPAAARPVAVLTTYCASWAIQLNRAMQGRDPDTGEVIPVDVGNSGGNSDAE